MTERERLARDFKDKAERCHAAWSALQLAQVGQRRQSESIAALWARFQEARKELHAAYNALNEQSPKNPLGPLEWYYV